MHESACHLKVFGMCEGAAEAASSRRSLSVEQQVDESEQRQARKRDTVLAAFRSITLIPL
jgi:hypothetical protein